MLVSRPWLRKPPGECAHHPAATAGFASQINWSGSSRLFIALRRGGFADDAAVFVAEHMMAKGRWRLAPGVHRRIVEPAGGRCSCLVELHLAVGGPDTSSRKPSAGPCLSCHHAQLAVVLGQLHVHGVGVVGGRAGLAGGGDFNQHVGPLEGFRQVEAGLSGLPAVSLPA